MNRISAQGNPGREESANLNRWLVASAIKRESLDALLEFLSRLPDLDAGEESGWHYQRISGGWNNRVYRVQNAGLDWTVKFTRRDERRRAMWEYSGLFLVADVGCPLAPIPLFVDEDSFPQPVIIQSWLLGNGYARAPRSDAGLRAMAAYYRDLHHIRKEDIIQPLPDAVLSPRSAAEARTLTDSQLGLNSPEKLPRNLLEIISRLNATNFPEWQPPPEVLLRNDPTPRNFIRRGHLLFSVDWENCGWGDAAFEMADWLAHPDYLHISPQTKTRLVEFHGGAVCDPEFNL